MKNIFVFLGNEELIIKNKIEKLIKSLNCDELNSTVYDLDEVSLSHVIQDASTPPFMTEHKVLLLKNPLFLTSIKEDTSNGVKEFIAFLENPFSSTTIIIDAGGLKLDERKQVVKAIKAHANINETKELTSIEAEGWLKRQFAIEGLEIKDDAVKLFFERIGRNLLNAKNEVDKLLTYISPRKQVTYNDILEVVTKEPETEVFALTSSIIAKNKEKTMEVYQQLTKTGKDALQLMNLVARSMIDMLFVQSLIDKGLKQNDIAQALKVSPGRAYYLTRDAKSFDRKIIEDYICQLANLDLRIKTGQVDATTGVELFLFGL